jgi:hypothetical protein
MMVMMVMMMMVRLRECGSRNQHDHGKKQSLFHVQIITNKRAARMPPAVTLGLPMLPKDVRPRLGEVFQRCHHRVALVPGTEKEDQSDEQVDKVEIR